MANSYSINPVTSEFINWLKDTIAHAGTIVVNHLMPVVTGDELYEMLVPDEHVRNIMMQAGDLMTPVLYDNTHDLEIFNVSDLLTHNRYFNLRVEFINRRNCLLFPREHVRFGEPGRFTELFRPAFKEARDWATLQHVTNRLINITNNRHVLSSMFTWLPSLIADTTWARKDKHPFYYSIGARTVVTQEKVERDFIAASKPPILHIAMTANVRVAAGSGERLFTQYRLLKALQNKSTVKLERDVTTHITINERLIAASIMEGLEDTREFNERRRQEIQSERYERPIRYKT